MKILLLFPYQDGQTGCAIKYAFEKLGHIVKAIDAKLEPEKSYEASLDFEPDLVFCSRTPELAEQVIKIKQRFKNVIACCWNVDSRPQFYFWKYLFPLIKACDYYFVVDYNFLDKWRKEVNTNTFWLPQGVQNEVYNKPRQITQADINKYACDASFIGAMGKVYDDRNDYIFPLTKIGINFKHWGGGKPEVWNEEHNKAVSLSRINIACSGCPHVGRYTSVRTWKLLGAGGFTIERRMEGIEHLFPCGKDDKVLDLYDSPQDLIDKIKYWLPREEERSIIRERGYRYAHKNTYTERIKRALEIMGWKN